jgi:anti-sigma regulatory factor (Ser/Thr protein kinase)
LVSELFGNSVRHSGSGVAGETVTVAVRAGSGLVRVEVTDRSGPGVPRLLPAGRDREDGRGWNWWRGWLRGGGGGGAAGGR